MLNKWQRIRIIYNKLFHWNFKEPGWWRLEYGNKIIYLLPNGLKKTIAVKLACFQKFACNSNTIYYIYHRSMYRWAELFLCIIFAYNYHQITVPSIFALSWLLLFIKISYRYLIRDMIVSKAPNRIIEAWCFVASKNRWT